MVGRQTGRFLGQQQEILAVESEVVFPDGVRLVFHFDVQVFQPEHFFRQRNDVLEFSRFQPVVKIVRIPQLEVDDFFGPDYTAAIDEMFGDDADFGDVEMFGYERAIFELEVDRIDGVEQ